MSGLFDEISRKLDAEAGERGISAWDMADLSPPLRKIVRAMLREVELSYPELCRLAKATPNEERLTQSELDNALQRLQNQNWIVRVGQGDLVSYRVNLRRKRGSQLSSNLWEMLSRRLSGSPDKE